MTERKHILVVEDDPDISNVLVDLFTDVGFNTITAVSATMALNQLKTKNVDIITLDLRLPDKSGNEFIKELAKNSINKPIVVISANLENLKPNPLVKAALPKPFDMDNLLNIIEQYV
jgi:DNA-binding response OmpR family regulator